MKLAASKRHIHTLEYACGHTVTIALVGRYYRLHPEHLQRRMADARQRKCDACNQAAAEGRTK